MVLLFYTTMEVYTKFGMVSTSISALYILIFYLAKIEDLTFRDYDSKYIDSNYCYGHLLVSPSEQLPGFEKDKSEPIDLDHFNVSDIIKEID